MKKIWTLLFILFLPACKETPSQPAPTAQPLSQVVAYVHWNSQPLAGRQIELLQTGETKLTDSTGVAAFSLSPGKYTIRAIGINRGGPAPRNVDFNVEVLSGQKATVDIIDCLPCV